MSCDMQSRPFIRAAFLYGKFWHFLYVKERLGGKNEIVKAKNIAGKFYAVFVIFWSREFQGQPQSLLKWRLHRIFGRCITEMVYGRLFTGIFYAGICGNEKFRHISYPGKWSMDFALYCIIAVWRTWSSTAGSHFYTGMSDHLCRIDYVHLPVFLWTYEKIKLPPVGIGDFGILIFNL